jgi:hypothetical protein
VRRSVLVELFDSEEDVQQQNISSFIEHSNSVCFGLGLSADCRDLSVRSVKKGLASRTGSIQSNNERLFVYRTFVEGKHGVTVPEDQIKDIKADMTLIGGKIIFQR